jgi:hypothetical protein
MAYPAFRLIGMCRRSTSLHRVVRAWIPGLRHNSRHKLSVLGIDGVQRASGLFPNSRLHMVSARIRYRISPEFKLIARGVAKYLGYLLCPPKNIKIWFSRRVSRGLGHFSVEPQTGDENFCHFMNGSEWGTCEPFAARYTLPR